MRLTDLADVVHAAGLRVVEVDGWQTRGRSGDGGQYLDGRPDYVAVHHTASRTTPENDAAYICHGAQYAPLANLLLVRSGAVWICAAGPTNTNGKGGPLPGVAADDLNRHAIGVEASNDGVGEPWPNEQSAAYVVLCAALVEAYPHIPDASHVVAHHEWSPGRKIDPAGPSPWAGGATPWNMDGFRRSVTRALGTVTEPPTPLPDPTGDDPMTLYAATDAAGTVWIGNGVDRFAVSDPDDVNLIALRGALGSGPPLRLACGAGEPANMDNVGTCRMNAQQLRTLGRRVIK